ncbi:MAG: flavodoxin domain-containing protein [Lachnobacterium sp.]|nr:flavodoxin domain-containing protein [Lachnobacterium sp.]
MSKVNVVYWSQSGNTQAMAEAVGKGAADAGAEVSVVYVGDASVNDLKDCKAFALGCPAMGAEMLEESEMDPFVADVESICGGKTIGLFGSYGWGDGQWMRDWEDRMRGAGATISGGPLSFYYQSFCKRRLSKNADIAITTIKEIL